MSEWKEWVNIIDTWWKVVLILGIICTIGASTINIDFLDPKHLFGFGFGLILIGLGCWKSYKPFSKIEYGLLKTWFEHRYDIVSIIMIALGTILSVLFAYDIIKGLL